MNTPDLKEARRRTNNKVSIKDNEYKVTDKQKKIGLNKKYYIKKNNIVFSREAQMVFDAGRELWRYYHKQKNANPNASFYDIRAYFQGRDKSGKMKKESSDVVYMELITKLRSAQKKLAKKISYKVYKYGFLRG